MDRQRAEGALNGTSSVVSRLPGQWLKKGECRRVLHAKRLCCSAPIGFACIEIHASALRCTISAGKIPSADDTKVKSIGL
jgi:hypothetical protein